MLPSEYEFRTKPYEHQRKVFEMICDRESFALFLDMGTGKSKVSIDGIGYLFLNQKINGVIIFAPKGVYSNWEKKEIPQHLPEAILAKTNVIKWAKHKTKTFQEKLKLFENPSPDRLDILIVNIEALNSKTKDAIKVCVKFLLSHNTLALIDESTIIKCPTTNWTKVAIKLGRGAKYRRILTGTPVTNSPLDLYSQFEFLDPKILGFSSFYAFKARYAKTQKIQTNTRTFEQIVGYHRLEELQEKMRTASIIIKKEDCLDLPDKIYMTRDVEMSAEQARVYDQLKKLSMAFFEDNKTLTVTMALTKILRLHQVACGFVTLDEYAPECDEDGNPVCIGREIREIDPDGGPRIKELLSVLENIDTKTIIWGNYTYNINTMERILKKVYGEKAVGVYAGKTEQSVREQMIKDFQDPGHPLRYFIGQPRSGGWGLTLTEAKHVIYFSNNYSLESRMQSEDRAHRIGQTSNVVYTDLVCPNTVDEKIIKVLKDKKSLADLITSGQVLDLFS